MPRYAAFLRGISPMNAKMSELARAFESAGFDDVRTVLSSGNLVFDATARTPSAVERKAEAAMRRVLGKSFTTFARRVDHLRALIDADPFRAFAPRANEKRIVTFLKEPPKARPKLPIELDGARILAIRGGEIFSAYVPGNKGAVFMTLIEKTFGKNVTTRTLQTVEKVVR